MSVNFLHGIESIELDKGVRPVTVVKSAVIGIVGIAPSGPSAPTLVLSDRDAAQFGPKTPGFNIPQALDSIFQQGAGTVIVVNVFDVEDHTVAVVDEVQIITDRKAKLAFYPVGDITVEDNAGAAVAFEEGSDYKFDNFGNFTVLSGLIANGVTLKFSYNKLNPALVLPATIIGTADAGGNKTGLKALELGFNLFGFSPKILIVPGYSHVVSISAAMIIEAEKLKAIALLDAPHGTTVAQALTNRGVGADANFATSSKRAMLLYPYLKAYDEASGLNADFPYSQFMAGVIAATDNSDGYWRSPSNKEIKGIIGAERNISAGISDAQSDANILNEQGITTIFNSYGTGYRTWGNRSASFPTNTGPDNFIAIRRIADVVEESIEQASLQFIDRPISNALIDDIRETGNAFMNVLIGRGAIIQGSKITFDPAKNTPIQLAAGNITFSLNFMGPTPAERITIEYFLDINLLKNIK